MLPSITVLKARATIFENPLFGFGYELWIAELHCVAERNFGIRHPSLHRILSRIDHVDHIALTQAGNLIEPLLEKERRAFGSDSFESDFLFSLKLGALSIAGCLPRCLGAFLRFSFVSLSLIQFLLGWRRGRWRGRWRVRVRGRGLGRRSRLYRYRRAFKDPADLVRPLVVLARAVGLRAALRIRCRGNVDRKHQSQDCPSHLCHSVIESNLRASSQTRGDLRPSSAQMRLEQPVEGADHLLVLVLATSCAIGGEESPHDAEPLGVGAVCPANDVVKA